MAVKEITDRLDSLGGDEDDVRFDLITAKMDRKLPRFECIGNVDVYRIGFGIKFDKFLLPILGFSRAIKLNKKNKYNLVWAVMASYGGFAAMFFKKKNPKTPFLLTLQEGDSEKHILKRVGIFYPLWKKIFSSADYIQVISNYLADFAKKYGAKCPIEVVPNGVDIDKFQNPKSEIRNKLKIKNFKQEINLITVSRLVEKNAVGDIIEAMKYLPENVKLLIIGTGELENKLKLKTKNEKLETRINFLGHINHKELPEYLASADIFIRPSLSEGLGNAFLEAMEAGVPVIATPVGGIPDFMKDEETGLFCNVSDPKSIAEKIKIYLENEDLRNKIIANAKEMIEKNYDWNLIAERMKKIFEKL